MQGFLAILLVIVILMMGLAAGILSVTADKLSKEVERLRYASLELADRREASRLNNRVLQLRDYIDKLLNATMLATGTLVVGLAAGMVTIITLVVIVSVIYFVGKKVIEYGGEIMTIKVLNKHKEMEEKRNEERDKYTIM